MGVYADRTASPFDDPRVETITSLARRKLDLAIGIVTNTEVEDATPAAMVAHTRRRNTYNDIVEQFFAAGPDVLMGGGLANFLPKGAPGSKRADETDYVARFKEAGYAYAATATELAAAANNADTRKLLGLFALGNMDGVLDRKFLKGGGVAKSPDQPDLTQQMQAALERITQEGQGGMLVYMAGHEGRGIGLWAKAATYLLQDGGEDTYQANRSLGLPDDSRDFSDAASLLKYFLGGRPFRLLTNNPKKVNDLGDYGVAGITRVKHVTGVSDSNRRYLSAKQDWGHEIEPEDIA